MFDVPSWSMVTNVLYFRSSGNKKLLITVGDSWTYGDSLGNTKVRNGVDDEEYRLSHVYGHLMSESLQFDWANIALPGGSNTCVVSWLSMFLDTMHKQYDEIICTVTLTESGRHEDMQYIDRTLTQQQNLEKIVAIAYGQVQTIALKHPKVKFIIAHNFTDPVGVTACDKTWLEVMLGKQVRNNTHIVVSEHIKQMNYDIRFSDVLDVMDKAEARMDVLDSCDHCYKEDSRHPNEKGHAMWAEYLLTKI
jgi:hypothetical protein